MTQHRFDLLTRLAVLLAGALVCAGWASRILAPGPVLALPSPPPLDAASTLKIFAVPQAATRLDGVRLTGVYASSTGAGFASFATASGPIAVAVGTEVAPGVRLQAVEAGLAVLDERGREVRLVLPDTNKGEL